MQEGSRKAVMAAFLADVGIAVAKFVGFLATGAASMLAEAMHSVADTTNQGLLLVGGRKASRPATAEHPFGYGRERFFWAFVVAQLIFTVGAMFALAEGVEKLRHPHRLESLTWAVAILVVAIAFEGLSLRTAVRESSRERGRESWWRFIRRSKTPELPVVLLEDLGALTGLGFALVGVTLAHVTGNPRFDAVGTLAIGLLLGAIAVTLAVEMKSLLIGESASKATEDSICRAIKESGDVRRILHLRTQHLGPDELLVGTKVELDEKLDFAGVAAAIDRVEHSVRQAVPAARVIYVEPDFLRPERLEAGEADPAGRYRQG